MCWPPMCPIYWATATASRAQWAANTCCGRDLWVPRNQCVAAAQQSASKRSGGRRQVVLAREGSGEEEDEQGREPQAGQWFQDRHAPQQRVSICWLSASRI